MRKEMKRDQKRSKEIKRDEKDRDKLNTSFYNLF
jgi:hypothetical protein